MPASAARNLFAGDSDPGIVDGEGGIVGCDVRRRAPRGADKGARRRVLVEVAQNIGQLQRAAEMEGERIAWLGAKAENAHGKATHRAGHAIAIEIERRPMGARSVLSASIWTPLMTASKMRFKP